MVRSPRELRRAGTATALFVAFVLAAAIIPRPTPGHAAGLLCVQGRVTSVWGTEITIQGKAYDIAGAPVRDCNGRAVPREEIARDRKVSLYYRGGKLFQVVVYPKITE